MEIAFVKKPTRFAEGRLALLANQLDQMGIVKPFFPALGKGGQIPEIALIESEPELISAIENPTQAGVA
jgi:hypothetical protein